MRINSNCVVCKGRDPKKYCGRSACPIMMKNQATAKVRDLKIGENLQSDSPAVFVGRHGYPNINVGFLTPPEKKDDTWLYDAPKEWAGKEFGVNNVIGYRSELVNSRFKTNVKSEGLYDKKNNIPDSKMINMAQEVTQSIEPVDLEVDLEKKPKINTNFDPYVAPTGPNGNIKKVDVTANVKVNKQVEKRVGDTDLLSNQAVKELYGKGYDENFLSKLLSMGNLGIGKNRRLVPTRWSITAVDDNVGKEKIDAIKDYDTFEQSLYFGGYLGNYFIIMFLEDVWGYELFETYMPNASWNQGDEMSYTTDHEGYEGRKSYAKNCAGGYYASRLPIVEFLAEKKKQAKVIVFRVITGEYSCPLGVWVVREAVRKALEGKRHMFDDRSKMMDYARFITNKKFSFDLDKLLNTSKLYNELKTQKKIREWLR